jgi:tRNA pseudouridine synthase B (EC 4.2.1.70)
MDGILLVNKPKFITSNDLVIKIKKHLNEKMGHTGTLDYAASGLMVLTVGQGTKITQYLQKLDKQYIAEGKLGEITDTYDSQGKIIETKPVEIDEEKLKEIIFSFIGEYYQTPPPYSSKRIGGTRAYKLAKKGVEVQLKPVLVKIYNIEILEINLPYFKIKVDCSSGTYIRSLIKDIGDKAGCGAYMTDLVRTKIGQFDLKDALSFEEILKKNPNQIKLISLKDALYFLPKIKLNQDYEKRFKHGQRLIVDCMESKDVKVLNEKHELIGIGEIKECVLKPKIVLARSEN